MPATVSIITPASPAPQAATCGGCFKPVNPETSLKRPTYTAAPRYGRYTRALPQPVALHFCNNDCRQLADNAASGNGGFRF